MHTASSKGNRTPVFHSLESFIGRAKVRERPSPMQDKGWSRKHNIKAHRVSDASEVTSKTRRVDNCRLAKRTSEIVGEGRMSAVENTHSRTTAYMKVFRNFRIFLHMLVLACVRAEVMNVPT